MAKDGNGLVGLDARRAIHVDRLDVLPELDIVETAETVETAAGAPDVIDLRDGRDRRHDVPTVEPRLLTGSAILVGSSGGHLAQLLAIAPLWAKDQRSYVTFDTVDAVSLLAEEQVTWAHHPTTRNLRNLVRNSVLAFREVRRRRPDVVVSTGAAVAFPFFIAARLRGIPTVYLEVYDRVDSPTLTGRLCRPLSTLFCVQWPEQLEFYRGSELVGSLM